MEVYSLKGDPFQWSQNRIPKSHRSHDRTFHCSPILAGSGADLFAARHIISASGTTPQASLEKHNRELPYVIQGVPIPDSYELMTVGELCDLFLEDRVGDVQAGEISARHFADLKRAAKFVVDIVDRRRPVESLVPRDFKDIRRAITLRTKSPTILGNQIQRIRQIFAWGCQNFYFQTPVRYGPAFDKPPVSTTTPKTCQICGSGRTAVYQTINGHRSISRVRECRRCGYRWKTREELVPEELSDALSGS